MPRVTPLLVVGLACLFCRPVMAQDNPLAEILIDGQDWELVGEGFTFTEGPACDPQGRLYFTDVFKSKIHRLDAQGKPEVFVDQSHGTNGLEFGADGRLYGCQNGKKRIVVYDSAGNDTAIAEDVNSNDLVVTRKGGVYFTDPGHHQVWYIPPKGEKRVVDEGLKYPNGLGLSPDESTLVVVDMNDKYLFAYRVGSDGSLSDKQPFYTMRTIKAKKTSGGDGMCIDSAGRVYCTSEAGLQVFDTQGRLIGVIDKPQVAWLANVAFGGPDFKTLYVTCTNRVFKRQVKAEGIRPGSPDQAKK
jgi:gluconolactonase